MKEMDTVEVIVEKEKYAKEGVHKGMQGWICDPNNTNNTWLINFPRYGPKDDVATISIKEEDLMEINGMDARVNEEIEKQFGVAYVPTKTMLDLTECKHFNDVHGAFRGALNFSDDYGKTWDSFLECLQKDCEYEFITVIVSKNLSDEIKTMLKPMFEMLERHKRSEAEHNKYFDYEIVVEE